MAVVMLYGANNCADFFEMHDTPGTKYGQTSGSIMAGIGSWYHVAFVYSASAGTGAIYVNGSLSGSASAFPNTPTYAVNTTRLYNYFGKTPDNQYGNVTLDEVRLYSKALTQAQIQTDMASASIPTSGIC
jgi:hypothetical protein